MAFRGVFTQAPRVKFFDVNSRVFDTDISWVNACCLQSRTVWIRFDVGITSVNKVDVDVNPRKNRFVQLQWILPPGVNPASDEVRADL